MDKVFLCRKALASHRTDRAVVPMRRMDGVAGSTCGEAANRRSALFPDRSVCLALLRGPRDARFRAMRRATSNSGSKGNHLGIYTGRGQVPFRHAVRISLGWTLKSREMLYNTLIWGFASGVFNSFIVPARARPAVITSALLMTLFISYTSMIPWRWRIVHRGASVRKIVLSNGLFAFVLGYLFFYFSLCVGMAIWFGPDVLLQGEEHKVFAGVSFGGIIYAVVGWYITSGYDGERFERRALHREKRLQRLADEARVVALRAQINPHFFFNALNTIAALIPVRPGDAERAVELLAASLRPVLMRDQPMTAPLESELRVAKAYADIEKLRLGDRLEVQFDVPTELHELQIPSLSLQPLLENAVRHGASKTARRTLVILRAQRVAGGHLLSIENRPLNSADSNGHHLDPVSRKPGHAVDNLHLRAKALFGSNASVETRVSGNGLLAVAEIFLPETETG